jgi:parallel beta-helix repeat protein
MSLIASPRHGRFWVQVLAGVGLVIVLGSGLGSGDRAAAQSAISIPVPRPEQSPPRSAPRPASRPASSQEAIQQFLFVNPMVGDDDSDGATQRSPFRSLTRAIKAAQPNTVIMLAEGIYSTDSGESFPLIVPEGVQLQGDPSSKGERVVIEGGGSFATAGTGRQNVAIVTRGQIVGVTISNPNLNGYGLWIESGSPVIANSTFTGNNLAGVAVMGSSTPTLRGNQFSQNRTGLVVAETAQPTLRNNSDESSVAQASSQQTTSQRLTQRQSTAQQSTAQQSTARQPRSTAQASVLLASSSRATEGTPLISTPPPSRSAQSRSATVTIPVPQPAQVAELRRDLPVSRSTPIPVAAPQNPLPFSPPPASDTSQSNLLRVPAEPPIGHVGNLPTVNVARNPLQSRESSSRQSASARGLRYRVVASGSASRVRSLFPNAFSTYSGGQSVMQVGAFGDRENAEEAAQILESNGLNGVIETLDN